MINNEKDTEDHPTRELVLRELVFLTGLFLAILAILILIFSIVCVLSSCGGFVPISGEKGTCTPAIGVEGHESNPQISSLPPTPLPYPPTKPPGWEPIVSEAEIDMIARTLACEASYYDLEDARAVAWVIRTRHEITGKSYTEVLLEPDQFSCWSKSYPLSESAVKKRDEFCEYLPIGQCQWFLEVAKEVTYGWMENPAPGATNFYSACHIEAPSWADERYFVKAIGCHRFYKLSKGVQ